MYVPDGIDAFLKKAPEGAEYIRVQSAEVILTDDAGAGSHYRLPIERDVAKRVYGEAARLFGPKRKGLVGHPQGKSFVRTGIDDIALRQHWAQSPGGRQVNEVFVPARSGAALLHHVGDNFEVWRSKLQWRVGSRGFTGPLSQAILEALEAEDAEERINALYQELHGCNENRLSRLKAEDAYFHVPVGPDQVASEILGDTV